MRTNEVELGEIFVNDGEALGVTLPNGSFYTLCRRCGGEGHYSYNMLDGTICYGCYGDGLGKKTTQADAIRLQNNRRKARRQRERKEQERLAAQEAERQAWAEANADTAEGLAAVLAADDATGVLLDLAQKARWRALTDAQTDLAARVLSEYRSRKIARQVEALRQQEAGHVGTPGEKVTLDVEVVFTKGIESSFNGRPTYSTLVIMKTDEGHTVKTFSAGQFGDNAEKGQRLRITGTVKQHEIREGLPETALTRVKAL